MHFTDQMICYAADIADKLAAQFRARSGWFSKKRLILIAGALVMLYITSRLIISLMLSLGMPVTAIEVQGEKVPLTLEFVGQTESIRTVDIRARVEGFLEKRAFVEGDDVRQGALLFTIDMRPFEEALREAEARLAQDRSAHEFAQKQVERYSSLVKKEYISQEDYDTLTTKEKELAAQVASDEAAVKQAKLNLGYCTMRAPFAGRIGRTFVDVGNLVGAGQDTKLATLVQLDPLYIYFSPSDRDAHRILHYQNKDGLPVRISLTDGTAYPEEGRLSFVDNQVDAQTSTLVMRAEIPNADQRLLPGVYVKVQVMLTEKPDAILVPQKAIGEDQAGPYLLLVDQESRVAQRRVSLGESQQDRQVITEGLSPGERVIVEGLQKLKPGMKVRARISSQDNRLQGIVRRAFQG